MLHGQRISFTVFYDLPIKLRLGKWVVKIVVGVWQYTKVIVEYQPVGYSAFIDLEMALNNDGGVNHLATLFLTSYKYVCRCPILGYVVPNAILSWAHNK